MAILEYCGHQLCYVLTRDWNVCNYSIYFSSDMNEIMPGFGDNVRIRVTPLTESLRLAGLRGNINGETTPSVTGVEVIGESTDDFALSVMFDERCEQLWFAPDLVEFLDHAPGMEIQVGDCHMIRRADGGWDKVCSDSTSMRKKFIAWLMRSFRGRNSK